MLTLITICDYLGVSLAEFFDFENNDYPIKINQIKDELLRLDNEELDLILGLAQYMNKSKGRY